MEQIIIDPEKGVRELKSLYRISELVERSGDDLDRIISGIAAILPEAFGTGGEICIRIDLNGKVYGTDGCKPTEGGINSPVVLGRKELGRIHAFRSLRRGRSAVSGSHGRGVASGFAAADDALLHTVAERLGKICERIQTKLELQQKEEAYRRRNIALNELLDQHSKEKQRIASQVQENIDTIVMPLIFDLERQLSDTTHEGTIRLLQQNLAEVTNPIISNLSRRFRSLTVRELQICKMIRQNLSSKEIGDVLHIAPATVHRHRESIRRKLKLKGEKVNLAAWMQGQSGLT